MSDFHRLTETTANRAYLVQTLTAHIAAFAFIANITLGIVDACNGHYAGLPARLGVAAFTIAAWFSASFRANLMRGRTTDGRALELLRRPSNWLPSFAFDRAVLGNETVELLPPETK
ncbi:hypothetical protein DBB29_08650 [Pandoraea cepalis]|uniref:Uncharacterized protein n=1 Tax=Pandoraea cepalis TaxID=2508294 RepID=A0AAW7MLN7_9BURK|nr:hypothetical protein [Pandoraea cepalis]MDN4573642.1 hypothetical protein [Pandoraea cepalis]MDN4578184.1 hypothetical protein [Pandoraea cepalis]